MLEKYKPIFDKSILDRVRPQPGAYPVMSISKDRSLRPGDEEWGFEAPFDLAMQLLRVMDLVDVSREKLPGLKRIDVNCENHREPIDQWEAADYEDDDGVVRMPPGITELEFLLEEDGLFG
ncbi:hypothetical protein RB597_000178 [Gaeumannomyces tritici]